MTLSQSDGVYHSITENAQRTCNLDAFLVTKLDHRKTEIYPAVYLGEKNPTMQGPFAVITATEIETPEKRGVSSAASSDLVYLLQFQSPKLELQRTIKN